MGNNDKMRILLEQIKLPAEQEATFRSAKLEKVVVHREKKQWEFHIHTETALTFEEFYTFYRHLERAFTNIAKVDLVLTASEAMVDEKELYLYWRYFVTTIPNILPSERTRLESAKIKDDTLHINVNSEAEKVPLQRKVEPTMRSFFNRYNLRPLHLKITIERNEEELNNFRKQTEKEHEAFVRQIQKNQKTKEKQTSKERPSEFVIGSSIHEEPVRLEQIVEEEKRMTVQGYVFSKEVRDLRSGRQLLLLKITDYTDSLEIKMFSRNSEQEELFSLVKEGMWIKARGPIQTDRFSNELVMMPYDMMEVHVPKKKDEAEDGKKRVELHAHTTMSQLDAVVSAKDLIKQAAEWGHDAIAITDHANVQSFPDAFYASLDHDIKVIYGMEANIVDDGVPIVYEPIEERLEDATYVVFDVETTGLSSVYDTIIEIAGVKMKKGEIIDRYESFANPHRPLPEKIIEITQITDDMLVNAPEVEEVLQEFYEWVGDSVLVAHNAMFDIGFLNVGYEKINLPKVQNAVIDTLELARYLFPQLGNHRLNTLCNHLNVELVQHHRAIYDAEATAYLFWKLIDQLKEANIERIDELNEQVNESNRFEQSRPFHCTLLVQNETGLKNLYKLVSYSHIDYFYRVPRIPRSLLNEHREGLLVGSACSDGEVFDAVMQKPIEELEELAQFYDFLEVQPIEQYYPLIERDVVHNEAQLIQIVRNIIELGKRVRIPVVATGNVHHLESQDRIYRKILIASQKGNPLNRVTLPDHSFKTTQEMLDSFSFLGEKLAYEIVVENSQQISQRIEKVSPLKSKLYTPSIEGAEEDIRRLTYDKATSIYGDPLPEIVEERLKTELDSIIGHGFSVIYLISHKLVKKSLDDGYLVGSRGSVGSSLVATMTEITEVNPLPPHYVCPSCQYSEFITDGSYGSGFDLPEKNCPKCATALHKDGQDIPFETFLGFEGDKVPDIDLNFSGEYQPTAHEYTRELFGEDYVYRAGTIGTIATKTAYGYVRGYANDKELYLRNAEIDRLVNGCTGVKRTTGQHPGGIIVVPEDKEIYDFTPIQYPADDKDSEWKTTHFAYESLEDSLLKLDILGHDDPTVIRMLQDLSGIDPRDIPLDDEKMMGIFSSTEPLGLKPEQIGNKVGTLGVPEFGTSFVRQMLEETKPKTFAELVIISGLSHGTDVWLGNAQELINNGICEIGDVIGCRDDIMVYLMQKGIEAQLAFTIMESVRKGRGLKDEWIVEMKEKGVPNWYIESCQKIKYMFPKAHAAAYVLMAVRIAYFKVYYPILFYAAYFSVRANDFEIDTMIRGSEALRKRINEIKEKGNEASPKERNVLTVLEVALEMNERGFRFQKVDLYRSDAINFIVEGDTLIPPFKTIEGLGINAAHNIVKAREQGEFLSKEDLRQKAKLSKTVIDELDAHGCLEGMEEENQLSFF